MRASLYTVPGLSCGNVSMMARPRGGDWLGDEIEALHDAGVDIVVSLLTDTEVRAFDLTEEAACCHQQGIAYLSFPIIDRSVPPFSEPTFTFLKQFQTALSEGKHITFHCRQGLGRAALMAASVLVLDGFTPEQAFDLLSRARGYTVPETEEQQVWVKAFYQLAW